MSEAYEYLTVVVGHGGRVELIYPYNIRMKKGDLSLLEVAKNNNFLFYHFLLNYVGENGWQLVSSFATENFPGSVNHIFCKRL